MQNRIEITEANLRNDRLVLTSEINDGAERKPAGRMLTDSDHFAFVYTELELNGFHDELGYLIENIKDNANYGEEMEERVKRIFL